MHELWKETDLLSYQLLGLPDLSIELDNHNYYVILQNNYLRGTGSNLWNKPIRGDPLRDWRGGGSQRPMISFHIVYLCFVRRISIIILLLLLERLLKQIVQPGSHLT